jgi:hypothetical protein
MRLEAPAPRPVGSMLHGQSINKKATQMGGLFIYWWSRGESNPRPQVLHRQFYILSLVV